MEKQLRKKIALTIPAQKWDIDVYSSNKNCYIAKALKKLGYKYISVGGFGITTINGVTYIPKNYFEGDMLEDAFAKNKSFKLTLIRKD